MKSGGSVTVSPRVTVCVREPLVPVTLKLAAPPGVVADVVKVKVSNELPGGAGLGWKLQAAPVGKPLQDSATGELTFPFTAMA